MAEAPNAAPKASNNDVGERESKTRKVNWNQRDNRRLISILVCDTCYSVVKSVYLLKPRYVHILHFT